MTVSRRHFLVHDDEVRPLTQSVLERVRRGALRLAAYAGRDLHVVEVSVELKDRTPVKVRGVTTTILSLDEEGAVRSRLLEDLRASLSASRSGHAPARVLWSPSRAQLDSITDLALARRKSKLKPPRATAVPTPARPSRRSRRVDGKGRRVV